MVGLVVMLSFVSCKDKLIRFDKTLSVDYMTFDYLSAKAKIRYKDNSQSINAIANIRIKKDSVVWMSISKLGIEGVRVMINKDSVFIMDKLGKRLMSQGFNELSEKYDFVIDYNLVESVVLGNLIYPYQKGKVAKSGDYLQYDQQLENFLFNNYIGANTKKLEKFTVEDVNTKNTISVNYSDFKAVSNEIFPFSIAASINYVEKSKNSINIDIGFSKAEIRSTPLSFPFKASSKYRRI